MSRHLRYVPEGGALVEVTTRTQDARFLLRPSAPLNAIIIGVLARAKERYPLRVCGVAFASSHYHLLLDVDDAQTLSRFMCYVNVRREVQENPMTKGVIPVRVGPDEGRGP